MALDSTTLREYMTLTGVSEIVDGQFDSAIADATTLKGHVTTNETALKFYSAYLLAKSVNWKELKKSGDTEFFEPNPETYLDLFNETIDSIEESFSDGTSGSIINSDPKYN